MTDGEFSKDDFLQSYDPKNLLRTELNLLLGLTLSANVISEIPQPKTTQKYIDDAVRLLEELHQAILAPANKMFSESLKAHASEGTPPESPMKSGLLLREAIFYGPESAFPFQYAEMAKERYRPDNDWLEANKGFKIEEACAVMEAVRDTLNEQNLVTYERFRQENPLDWTFLPNFVFTTTQVIEKSGVSGEKVELILETFSTHEKDAGLNILDASAYNKAASHPIVRLNDGTQLAFLEYSLFECLYDNPFYWIGQDKEYLGKHSQTRGAFVETLTERFLRQVFKGDHVYRNVIFKGEDGEIVGEADAILVFGYRVFIIQVKSKKLTLSARSGDDVSIGKDFRSAVQDAYDQAVECIEHIENGVQAFVDNQKLDSQRFIGVREYYPICITSEHYPSLSMQSRELLVLKKSPIIKYPLVLDIFTLDVMVEMLSTPLLFTDYLVKRTAAADQIVATHELIVLAWHLKQNLFLGKYDQIMLSDDILVELDLAMSVRRAGIEGPATPDGILTRFNDTPIGKIIEYIDRTERPDVHRLGELLLSMDGNAAQELNRGIATIMQQTANDGRQHDITMALENGGGITVHCNRLSPEKAQKKLTIHCTMRKYTEKRDQWFGLSIQPNGEPAFMMGIEHPWEYNDELESEAGEYRFRNVTHALDPKMKRKIGRNEKCPCGSGLKYKKCHGK